MCRKVTTFWRGNFCSEPRAASVEPPSRSKYQAMKSLARMTEFLDNGVLSNFSFPDGVLRGKLPKTRHLQAFGRRCHWRWHQLPRIALHRLKITTTVRRLDLGLRNVVPEIVEDTNEVAIEVGGEELAKLPGFVLRSGNDLSFCRVPFGEKFVYLSFAL